MKFLRSVARRGLRGVKLVISDAPEGLKAAISKVLSDTWQPGRVHFMRNALAYAGKTQRRVVFAWVGTAFAQDDAAGHASNGVTSLTRCAHACQSSPVCSMTPRLMSSRTWTSRASTEPKSIRQIRSNGSTGRSSAAPMSSATSQTEMP